RSHAKRVCQESRSVCLDGMFVRGPSACDGFKRRVVASPTCRAKPLPQPAERNAETKGETATMEPLPSGRENCACRRIRYLRGEVTDVLVDTAGAGRLRGTRDHLLGPAGAPSVHRRTGGLWHN